MTMTADSCPSDSFIEKHVFTGHKMLFNNKSMTQNPVKKEMEENGTKINGIYRRDYQLREKIFLLSDLIIKGNYDQIIKMYHKSELPWMQLHQTVLNLQYDFPVAMNKFLDYCWKKHVRFPWDDINHHIWQPPIE
jgi:hypothetical protein